MIKRKFVPQSGCHLEHDCYGFVTAVFYLESMNVVKTLATPYDL
jgi:hypothetical protein